MAKTPKPAEHHHYAQVEGVNVHWAEFGGSNEKPPVLLIHGLSDCHLAWRKIAPILAASRRVLVPDLPGHGLSGRPDATYELRWYANIMARWLAMLGIDTVDVAGHSLGGGVAQVMMLECPDRIRRLALVSSGGLGREIAFGLRLASIPWVVEHFGQPFMAPGTRLALKATGDTISREEIATISALNAQPGSAMAFARTVRGVINWRGQRHTFFQRGHEVAQLPAIGIFWGDRDRIIPVSHARALARYLVGARMVLFKGAGHYPHHQQPEAFAAALTAFFDDPTCVRARIIQRAAPAPTKALRPVDIVRLGPVSRSALSRAVRRG